MPTPAPGGRVLRFDDFELDTRAGELRKRGVRLRLQGQPLQVLAALLNRAGDVVTREELRAQIWTADTFVDFDHSLHNAIARLREVLGDSAETPRYVETLPRRGYRFIGRMDGTEVDAWWHDGQKHLDQAERVGSLERFVLWRPSDSDLAKHPHRAPLWVSALALGAMAVIGAAAVLFVLNVHGWRDRLFVHAAKPRIQSLAVLPLANLSGDPEQEYFADGMTDALITDLAQIRTLRVISRTSAMRYKGTRKPLPTIARELGVDGIVEGAVARSGGHVRITSQLIYAPADQHLWARTYERDLKDVLALQDEVAQAIADEVRVAVTREQRAGVRTRATVNPGAYEAYLKGRYFLNKRSPEALPKAIDYFQQAIDKDSAYAPPYAGLADSHAQFATWDLLPPRETMPKAKAAALKALEIDDHLVEAHVSAGMVSLLYDWDWPEARKHFERALTLDPAYPAAHEWYSDYLMILGRPKESLTEVKRAVDLDPVSPEMNHHVGWLLNVVGRADEAIEQEQKTLEMDPGFPPSHSVLATAYEAKGMHREALAEVERLSALSSHSSSGALADLVRIHARSGERSQALRELSELTALSKQSYVPSYRLAVVYRDLGDKEQCLRWLEKAREERSPYLPYVKTSAAWAPLRSDPRFSDLLRHVGPPE